MEDLSAEEDLLTVTVVRDEHGYGMKVSGDNPVYVQSVKEHGAAWRAGIRAGDQILRVDSVPVHCQTHQRVVHMIKANTSAVLTVQQNVQQRNKSTNKQTPITAPVPVDSEKQHQLALAKVSTLRLMLENEQKHVKELRNEVLKVPDVRKQAEIESGELRLAKFKREMDIIAASLVKAVSNKITSVQKPKNELAKSPKHTAITPTPHQPEHLTPAPSTPRNNRKSLEKTGSPPPNTSFLSGLPRSLSNLTGQSLRNLRQARANKPENIPIREDKRRHNNTVPLIPTTCLDNTPPPLPPRTRNPPVNPLAKPKPGGSNKYYPMHQSVPPERERHLRRSSHSLDGELDGPQPNSIAMQMNYPLVNVPPPPLQCLQTDNRTGLPIMHVRSQSSPEHLDHGIPRPGIESKEAWERGTPPPGTPPPPYAHNTQPCADPQRAIISMEEDDSPASDNSSYSGLFSNLRCVLESPARTAVLLNWLLGERRCPCACLLLVLTEGYRAAAGAPPAALRRWAYEIQSTFLMPHAVLQLSGVDENIANEIEHVLSNEFDKDELLRNVFRKARQKAKEELSQQLGEFQVKRQVGLGSMYAPDDKVLDRCDNDKAHEQLVVERLLTQRLAAAAAAAGEPAAGAAGGALLAALTAAAHQLHCRPATITAAVGGVRSTFLQRDKLYKQRLKQLAKQHPQPFVVRGHHLQLQALTAVAHCHSCDLVIWGLAPQAYVCADCNLRVHRACARAVEESCCLDGEHHHNRISRFMERINPNQLGNQDSSEKKSRKTSAASHFLNMERSYRKLEDEPATETTHLGPERRNESDESLYESADCHSDAISASDDALPRLQTPAFSKESLKLAVTDEEADVAIKKSHRKTMSLSNPLEIMRNIGDDWFETTKRELEKNSSKLQSRESLWSEEERDSVAVAGKKEKSLPNSRKSSTTELPKTRKPSKASSVSALNFLRRRKTVKEPEPVVMTDEIRNSTKSFLEEEKRHSSQCQSIEETDTEEEAPKKVDHRRRLSRQTSRSKSKMRGKSQSVNVNTLRKSHSGTLKKNKKKVAKTPKAGRSRQTSIVDATPIMKKKHSESLKHNLWLFSSGRGEARREGSSEEPGAEAELDVSDSKVADKDNNWRAAPPSGGARVNRAESCRERDAPRRGKHRNASDPNRLTAHNNHDLEPGAPAAPSGSSSSSSLSSRSNESNTAPPEQQASQSDWSEEEEPLSAAWADTLPPKALDSLQLSPSHRKRQELIHELIFSEGSHVRWLKVLGKVFLRPLEGQPSLLPPEELRSLLPNLPAVRDRHSRLYAELRTSRSEATDLVVKIRPIADAVLNTLGDSGYAPCLSKFCRQQRRALETLRERRRKSKELHQFLAAREQLPLCGRLQLRDLLACVWQRLTKYQLLLEGILKTVSDEDAETEEDIAQLKRALDTAKDVLHSVDTAIRTAENEHRLKSIQSKLEVRASGGECEELRRLDLTTKTLRTEGELAIRSDGNKRTAVLALLLEDMLVLLQREGDKFILKPISQPNQKGPLSPVILWDKVLFRPNAAVRNTFFLMNINQVQMHELSANTPAEYATWVKYIEETPLARLADLKPGGARAADTGTNVSRNPSDASEKSSTTEEVAEDTEADTSALSAVSATSAVSAAGAVSAPEREGSAAREEAGGEGNVAREGEEEVREKERHSIPRRPTVGRISTHGRDITAPLEPAAALTVTPAQAAHLVHTAEHVVTQLERLRRLDEDVARALRDKSALVGQLLGVPGEEYAEMADLAVADTLGHVDIKQELVAARLAADSAEDAPLHSLLLAAQAQAHQLTEALSSALTVSEASVAAARSGLCDSCTKRRSAIRAQSPSNPGPRVERDISFDMLAELDHADAHSDPLPLARRLAPLACGLQRALSAALAALQDTAEHRALRETNARLREENDRLRARARENQLADEVSLPRHAEDQILQDQQSNGG